MCLNFLLKVKNLIYSKFEKKDQESNEEVVNSITINSDENIDVNDNIDLNNIRMSIIYESMYYDDTYNYETIHNITNNEINCIIDEVIDNIKNEVK